MEQVVRRCNPIEEFLVVFFPLFFCLDLINETNNFIKKIENLIYLFYFYKMTTTFTITAKTQNCDEIYHPNITICKEKKQKEQCSICYELIRKKNSTTTVCGHNFHLTCLVKCVSKNIVNCPLCKRHLYKKETTMHELFENCKDEIFNFETFCFIMNIVNNDGITKCVKDFEKYEDAYDCDSDEENEKKFSIYNFEKSFINKINEILEN